MDETVVFVKDADVEAETILDLDVSGVVQRGQTNAMETTVSSRLKHGASSVLL